MTHTSVGMQWKNKGILCKPERLNVQSCNCNFIPLRVTKALPAHPDLLALRWVHADSSFEIKEKNNKKWQ